ncbi:haloacid dehalogenase-like hydrolase [Oxalobacter sp. OttesenSCG-928-P03]|nr:haloacid dehalogenase-like hydrolase [Oxalobacter sp. OttesenSCG-928-P03]
MLLPQFRNLAFGLFAALFFSLVSPSALAETDPLPSWNDLPAKHRIIAFVRQTVTPESARFLPAEKRIAVFDNDGTLWVEQPVYAQMVFTLDRIRAMAPSHPEWRTKEPFKAVLENDYKNIPGLSLDFFELMIPTHTEMTTGAFRKTVSEWAATARHPHFKRPYAKLVYRPMLELLAFLEKNGFQNYIVSGGEVEFVRALAGSAYGIPPNRVIGSALKTEYKEAATAPEIIRKKKIENISNGQNKALLIDRIIGINPVLAVGNSDGDYEMLEWTTAGKDGLGVIIHHTDEKREYAYDRLSGMGTLKKALDDASRQGWLVVDMKRDWLNVFPDE